MTIQTWKTNLFFVQEFTLPPSQIPWICWSDGLCSLSSAGSFAWLPQQIPSVCVRAASAASCLAGQSKYHETPIDIVIEQEVVLKQILEHLWDNSIWIPNESASPLRCNCIFVPPKDTTYHTKNYQNQSPVRQEQRATKSSHSHSKEFCFFTFWK